METTKITVEATVDAAIEKVWNCWTAPVHIIKWNNASPDWHTPYAENDLRTGGKFKSTMAARDGSMSFDFEGEYTNVVDQQLIEYALGDGRTVKVEFIEEGVAVKIIEQFDAEQMNPVDMQQAGWQAILNNFKSYTENL
ncbi:MAG: SRPBCC family protein [Bacteroidota bacterium]